MPHDSAHCSRGPNSEDSSAYDGGAFTPLTARALSIFHAVWLWLIVRKADLLERVPNLLKKNVVRVLSEGFCDFALLADWRIPLLRGPNTPKMPLLRDMSSIAAFCRYIGSKRCQAILMPLNRTFRYSGHRYIGPPTVRSTLIYENRTLILLYIRSSPL